MLSDSKQPALSMYLLWLMTVGSALTVANIYYNQPLLGEIGRELNISEATVNNIAMVTQIGYAVGLFLLTPLGDMLKRRPVIIIDFIVLILSLLVFAYSNVFGITLLASFFIGLCSVAPQMFIPIVATLSAPKDKNKNIGIVISGLLTGILASRVVSGIIGEYWGWREMYYLAAGIVFVLGLLIANSLPTMEPPFKGTYSQLMKSLVRYFIDMPKLRLLSFRSAIAFGSFLAFWTTLTFHLEREPFYAGSDVAGMLGIVGIGGALAASVIGRLSDKIAKDKLILVGILLMVLSWAIFGVWGFTYAGLIIGILLIDVGLQSIQVTSQIVVYSINPQATNRLNTIYMTSYFIGGSLGTFLGGKAWAYWGWNGVVITGGALVVVSLLIHIASRKKYNA